MSCISSRNKISRNIFFEKRSLHCIFVRYSIRLSKRKKWKKVLDRSHEKKMKKNVKSNWNKKQKTKRHGYQWWAFVYKNGTELHSVVTVDIINIPTRYNAQRYFGKLSVFFPWVSDCSANLCDDNLFDRLTHFRAFLFATLV